MSQDFRSADWYRVADIRPRLAPQVGVQRQLFRGEAWYVMYDPVNQKTLRITPQAWHLVARMDGGRSVQQLWDEAAVALGSEAPPQPDLIQLLSQLHESDMLVTDALPDLDELVRRRDKHRRERWQRNLMNPLSIRLRLWDPDAFLTRSLPWVSWAFGPVGLMVWLALCAPALMLALQHWTELTHDGGDRILSAGNLLTMVLVYPFVKGLHEMGHAWAAKHGGAEVHDMGLMFLVFAPVPYVDASGTSAFRDKRRRALVAAAGMLTELLLAALALYVWLAVEPGVLRSVAFSVMLICGASTVLFNGNPLLRYDGYFVLCDLIEMPNLAQRSNQYWLWLIRRHVFGLMQAQPPQATKGERRWFLFYAPAALFWRISITIGIALFLGREYLYLGMALGAWGLATLLLWPLVKGLRYVWTSPELSGRRTRPWLVTGGTVAALVLLLAVAPVPLTTYAEGVVWPADNAQLRAGEAGFVSALSVQPGQQVRAGDVAATLVNDKLATELEAAQAREEKQHRAWQAALSGASTEVRNAAPAPAAGSENSRVALALRASDLSHAQAALDHAERGVQQLAIVVRRDGRVEVPRASDAPGRWLRKGEMLGHVDTGEAPVVRVVVTQDDIDLVRHGLQGVEVRLAGRLAAIVPARVLREVPAGDDQLPSAALALDGGGTIAAAPREAAKPGQHEPKPPRALNRVFQFDLALPDDARGARIGERAHVRFLLREEPLAAQAWRRVRQLLLTQLTL